MTSQERTVWYYLRAHRFHNLEFRRQYPIGKYIVDFICREKRLIIEIDGGQHNDVNSILYDKIRTGYLNSKGYRVLRFWNNEVDCNINGVLAEIEKYIL